MTSYRSSYVPFLNSAQRSLGKGGRSCSGSETDMSSTSNENLSVEDKQALLSGVRQEPQGEERISTELSNTLIIHGNDFQDSPFYGKDSLDYLTPTSSSTGYCSNTSSSKSSPHRLPRPTLPVQELKEIPKHYLDQSEVLKHLAYEASQRLPSNSSSLRKAGLSRHHHHHHKASMDKNRLSLSHPDLSKAMPRPKTKGRAATFDAEYSNPGKDLIALALENVSLKQQLEVCLKKVSKLQQLESEVLRLQEAHQELVRSSEKREKLERAVRIRLEGEVRRLQELASQYKEHMESSLQSPATSQSSVADDSTNLRKELNTREVLIGQLLSQNKELAAERERQHLELQAQQATLDEQRAHITILDNALVTAQGNVVRLEAEARTQAERAAQLGALRIAADRRLQAEQRLRAQLERDLGQRDGKPSEPALDLRAKVRENEEKVINLEAEVARWEQRYLEESTLRQLAMDAASVPKDAKIAALEKTSQECEKIIAQARTDQLKHMDELYAAQRRAAELEGRIKDLESKLAERDAMITVLQSRTQEKSDLVGWARHVRSASSVTLTSIRDPVTTTTAAVTAAATTSTTATITAAPESSSLPEKTRLSNKDTLISVLRAERERHPSHYWQV